MQLKDIRHHHFTSLNVDTSNLLIFSNSETRADRNRRFNPESFVETVLKVFILHEVKALDRQFFRKLLKRCVRVAKCRKVCAERISYSLLYCRILNHVVNGICYRDCLSESPSKEEGKRFIHNLIVVVIKEGVPEHDRKQILFWSLLRISFECFSTLLNHFSDKVSYLVLIECQLSIILTNIKRRELIE